MLRGNVANIDTECTTADAAGDDSDDDNVSLECADSGLGLPSDHDADRTAVSAAVPSLTVCSSLSVASVHPVLSTPPGDVLHGQHSSPVC